MYVPIWYNPQVTSTSLYVPELYQKGILYPINLVYNNNIMTREDIHKIYNVSINFLSHHRLYSTLKRYIGTTKIDSNAYSRPIFPTINKLLYKTNKGTKDFYSILLATDSQANNYKQKWNDELNLNLNTLAWKNIYKICFSSIKDYFLICSNIR